MYPYPSRMLAARHLLAETRALIARMSPAPDQPRIKLLNRFVRDLKNAGLWQHPAITALYVAGHSAEAAKLNLFAANSATDSGDPVYTVDRGFAGDGVDAILTGTLSGGAPGDHHAGIYLQSGDVGMRFLGASLGSLQVSATAIATRSGAASTDLTATSGLKHGVINRAASADYEHYRNGALLAPITRTATSGTAIAALLFESADAAGLDVFHAGRAAAWHYGKALTAGEIAALYAALTTYLTAIGAV
jgi:hypothetical protein